MYFFPLLSSKSSIKAFLAKLSNILYASLWLTFQIFAAVFNLKAFIGSLATNLASSSVNNILKIWYKVFEGGAPCGNLFILSSRLL